VRNSERLFCELSVQEPRSRHNQRPPSHFGAGPASRSRLWYLLAFACQEPLVLLLRRQKRERQLRWLELDRIHLSWTGGLVSMPLLLWWILGETVSAPLQISHFHHRCYRQPLPLGYPEMRCLNWLMRTQNLWQNHYR